MPMVSRVAEAREHVLLWVRNGLAPGTAISVKSTAERLKMSHTPVREALEHLVGEGLLVSAPDRHGFAIPRLTVRDVAGLHLLFGCLLAALEPMSAAAAAAAAANDWRPDPDDPSGSMTRVLATARRDGRFAIIAACAYSTNLRLAPYRRAEPIVIADWAGELVRLQACLVDGGPELKPAIASFTMSRTDAAADIVAAVEDMHRKGRSPDSLS